MRGSIDSIQWHLALVVLSCRIVKLRRVMKVMEVMEASKYVFLTNVIILSLQHDRLF